MNFYLNFFKSFCVLTYMKKANQEIIFKSIRAALEAGSITQTEAMDAMADLIATKQKVASIPVISSKSSGGGCGSSSGGGCGSSSSGGGCGSSGGGCGSSGGGCGSSGSGGGGCGSSGSGGGGCGR